MPPSWILPSDTHSPGDANHTVDHNHIVDDLELLWYAKTNGINIVTEFGADPSGATSSSTALANADAAASPGQPLYAPTGKYLLSQPFASQRQGFTLVGDHGATASGDDASGDYGTVFTVSPTFTNPTWSSYATAAIMVLDQAPGTSGGGTTYGVRIKDIWIDGTGGAASVDGFAFYGPVYSVQLERCGAYKMTGNGFAGYQDSANTAGNNGPNPDGVYLYSCLAQTCGGYGYYGYFTDGAFTNCHAQTCGGNSNLDGYYILSGNVFLTACRADLNKGNGFTINHRSGDGYQDCIKLIGCGTQGNYYNGLNVINSSSGGTTKSMPVVVTGCDFGGDGQNNGSGGNYAGINVQGANEVYISGTAVNVYTQWLATGSPKYALQTATPGVPTVITMDGGVLNYSTGQSGAAVNDGAAAGGNINIGPTVQVAGGYNPATFTPIQNAPYLVAPTSYAPATATNLTVTGTSWAAFSSANVNTGSFTAPPSGSVLVTASFVIEEGTASQDAWVALAAHGTTTPTGNAYSTSIGTAPVTNTCTFLVTGLTPWASYNFDLIGACGTAGDTVVIVAYGSSTVSTTRGGPVTMTVQAV